MFYISVLYSPFYLQYLYHSVRHRYVQLVSMLLLSRFSHVPLCDARDGSPPGSPVPGILQARTLEWVAISFSNARPWDSPGKNTGVSCHFLLQCVKVKSEREVAQPCPTPSDPMDCTPPGSSIHGIFQARVLEWVAIAFSDSCLQCTENELSSHDTIVITAFFLLS